MINQYTIAISFITIMLVSCTTQLTERERNTIYVADQHIVYQDKRYPDFVALKAAINCNVASEVFISPLANTSSERFSRATADFMTMCGEPKLIKIQLTDD